MYKQNPSPLAKKMLGDLDKDGKMSSWETARQNAIESAAKMKGPRPLTPEESQKANKARRNKLIANKKPTPTKKTIGPEGSKKTQRLRARVQKNEDKLSTTEVNSKKEERLYKKGDRLDNKLRKSKEKDEVKRTVAKNYKKGYYGV
jgi:hypothetical protein